MKEKFLCGVNWLYRPSEIKLGKGILLEAVPNKVFYSFHWDEILSASLRHPCKVAFLPKDVELPSGTLSFVCPRVYDITNKCLWWLTDKDYINERQEVDQLLLKTQVEMHTTVHPGGRSRKSTSQLKANSDGVQYTVSAQVKVKKRERGDQSSEPIKRERITKTEEGEYAHCKLESFLKYEIAKITDTGGRLDSNGVEKLIQLMHPEGGDKKLDLACRSMLAGVIAATDQVECLGQFIHLKGLPVFDEWLQEVHKGKLGNSSSSNECDKPVEEFLLILLRALDKLPINLLALQMCNIGKSVNHLRTHKNIEIQKKARSLVDTWKKRVEAEMSINDSKSGSNQSVPWTTKRLSEVSHGGTNPGISTEVAMKSTVTQISTSKAASVKVVHDEVIGRSASASPGSMKSVPSPASASIGSGHPRTPVVTSANYLPQTVAGDEKSSSSSQSYNNSQSCSSEHAKTGGMGKEDARSSTAGSVAMNKAPGRSSWQRKAVNGFPGSAASGAQRETIPGRSSLMNKGMDSERISQYGDSCDKTPDVTFGEGHSHKFIVKSMNRACNAGPTASATSIEDPSLLNNRSSSIGLSKKRDHVDCSSKGKGDTHQATVISGVNIESLQSDDINDVSDGVQGSPAVINGEEGRGTIGDTKASKTDASSPGNENENEIGNLQKPSLSTINALIDSCVKYSEAIVSTSDDVEMNLLASVAAGVVSKSNLESPTDSPGRNIGAVDGFHGENELKVRASNDDVCESKQSVDAKLVSQDEEKPAGETTMASLETNSKKGEIISSVSSLSSLEKRKDNDGAKPERITASGLSGDANSGPKIMSSCLTNEGNVNNNVPNLDVEVDVVKGSSLSRPFFESGGKNTGELIEKKASVVEHHDSAEGNNDEVKHNSGMVEDFVMVNSGKMNTHKNDETAASTEFKRPDKQPMDSDANLVLETKDLARDSTVTNHDGERLKENLKCQDGEKQGRQVDLKVSLVFPFQDVDQSVKSRDSKLTAIEAEEADESTSTSADASSVLTAGIFDNDKNVGFDLNEGFDMDDEKCGEPSKSTASDCLATLQLSSPIIFPPSVVSSTIPSSITVAAAAKRPFVPPEDLLRSKGELGWKGSAATSAFRPAEPRKLLEMQFGTTSTQHSEASVVKNSCPPLDIDLNLPGERTLEDMNTRSSVAVPVSNNRENNNLEHDMGSKSMRSSGGFDLDLNQVNAFTDASHYSANNDCRTDVGFAVKSPCNPLRNHFIGEWSACRDFDLNGPFMGEAGVELPHFSQHAKSSVPSHQAYVSGLWMNNAELGNLSTWFPPGNTYPTVTIPSVMTEREEHPFPVYTGGSQRMMGPTSGGNPFSPDLHRGPVVSSSSAVPFPSRPF